MKPSGYLMVIAAMFVVIMVSNTFWAIAYKGLENDVVLLTYKSGHRNDLMDKAYCPESPFQEVEVHLLDGGMYKCGAVRAIPVHQKELERWYKAEAKRLLKNENPTAKGGG